MTVVADAAGVCCCLPGGGRGAGDGVSGSGFGDSGVLDRLLACQARHEAGLCSGGGGAGAGHDVLMLVDCKVGLLLGMMRFGCLVLLR